MQYDVFLTFNSRKISSPAQLNLELPHNADISENINKSMIYN